MTLLSTLGYCPKKKDRIPPLKQIECSEISVVIPVKDNQAGIDLFITEFITVTSEINYPKEIIIVDNNSREPLRVNQSYPISVKVFSCSEVGPAAARNVGVRNASGQWILFTDSDCIPTSTMISGYCRTDNSALGYAGGINILSEDPLSKYYKTQEILIPPEATYYDHERPDYLVTANCLIMKSAIVHVGYFDINFKQAGGEDVDLAFRLLEIGELEYCFDSVTKHNFDDGLVGFIKRFIRYGKGNRQLAHKYNLNLQPRPFIPQGVTIYSCLLALLQYSTMLNGYLRHREPVHLGQIVTHYDVPKPRGHHLT